MFCSFHTRGPERPQETQHTGLQKVLVLHVMLRSLISTCYPQTFLPAAKSAPLALLAPVINLCSKLWTRETPETSNCLLNLCNCLKKRSSIPRSMNSFVTRFTWTGLMQTFDQKYAEVQTWHSSRDTNDCSLKYKSSFPLLLLARSLWRTMQKGWLLFFGFGTQFDEYTVEVM